MSTSLCSNALAEYHSGTNPAARAGSGPTPK